MMQPDGRIAYIPRSGTTLDTELSALVIVYRFILDCHATKEATRPGGPNDVVKESSGYDATTNSIS
jgi:hypothetical protein